MVGENDILVLAGLVGLAWRWPGTGPVRAALALGLALWMKLLFAPFALVCTDWLAAGARHGRLGRSRAVRAARVLVLPGCCDDGAVLAWLPAR